MPHGLDHIVHAVGDLDAAGEFYRRAGFTVGARNRHPWGTHNRIVQFAGVFIELVNVGEPELIVASAPGSFSFGGFARDFLAHDEGLAMLVLESRGAAADAKAFRGARIGDPKDYPSGPEVARTMREISPRLHAALAALEDEKLNRPASLPIPGIKTLTDELAFFALHDAYHVGQLAYIRKGLGYPGLAG